MFCSVIKEDTSLINQLKDYPELEPYVKMRQLFKAVQDIRYGSLTGFKREGAGKLATGFGDLSIDSRVLLLENMTALGLTIPQNEVFEIYRVVRQREFPEGNPLTRGLSVERKNLASLCPFRAANCNHFLTLSMFITTPPFSR